MRAQGMKTILMGGDALVSKELGQIAGPDVEGTLLTFSPDPRKNPAAAGVVHNTRPRMSTPRDMYSTLTPPCRPGRAPWKKRKSFDPTKVKAALDSGEFDTVLGKFKFDGKGDPSLVPYVVYKWNKTDYEQE